MPIFSPTRSRSTESSSRMNRKSRWLRADGFGAVKSALILIGSEGGFTPEEKAQGEQAGYIHWYIGNRRLRSATGTIVAVAMAILGAEEGP